jgi:hypothetical protein
VIAFNIFRSFSRYSPLYSVFSQHQVRKIINCFEIFALALCSSLGIMSSKNEFGVSKRRRLTGNQRKKLRESQASVIGISSDELLRQRRDRMQEWKREQQFLSSSRCPNCGITGHSFKWCPFSSDFYAQKGNVIRFRGPSGAWSEQSLELSPEEKRRFRHFFGLLCMPLGLKSSETLSAAQSDPNQTIHKSIYQDAI